MPDFSLKSNVESLKCAGDRIVSLWSKVREAGELLILTAKIFRLSLG